MAKTTSTLNRRQIVSIIIVFLLVIGVWLANLLWLHKREDAGTIGSLFGAVSALFTGLAFAGLIFTILLQHNELVLQRQELSETRAEFVQQNATLKQQRFENTFFSMINVHHQIVASIPTGLVTGRLALNDIVTRHMLPFLKTQRPYQDIGEQKLSDEDMQSFAVTLAMEYYNGFYKDFEPIFNHYFRHLYHIYKYVYFSPLTVEEKDFYAGVMGAQLSQYELLLLAFNGIKLRYGFPKFLYLMREFDVLRNFEWSVIKDPLTQKVIRFAVAHASYCFEQPKPENRKVS